MNSRHTTWFLIAISAVFLYLGLTGLGNAWFWDDESFTSILAKNWNSTGEITSWDGRNLAAYRNGEFLTEDLTNDVTPVHIIAVGISQKIFGATTFAGRFPSVLAGLVALLLLSYTLSRQFGRGSPTHLYMVALYALSTSQLLFVRTGRYYVLSLALCLALYSLYLIYIEKRNPIAILSMAPIMAISYFTNPLLWICFSGALAVHFLIFHIRTLSIRDVKWIGISAALVAAACLPSFIKNQVWAITSEESVIAYHINKLNILWYYFRDFNLLGIFAWPMTIALIGIFSWRVFKTKTTSLKTIQPWVDWAVIGLAYSVILVLLTWQPSQSTAFADMRYAVPALPFLTIFAAAACTILHRRHIALGISLATVLTLTNILGAIPSERWTAKWLLPNLLKEIHNPYPTAVSKAAEFLQQNAQQDDLVHVFPTYESYPLMFYVGDKVKITGILNESSPAKGMIPGDPDHLYMERVTPDWIILYGLQADLTKVASYFGRSKTPGSTTPAANYKIATSLDVHWANSQKPEPAAHQFTPRKNFDPKREGVIVLKRVPVEPAS